MPLLDFPLIPLHISIRVFAQFLLPLRMLELNALGRRLRGGETNMGLVMWIIFGAIVGFIADYIDRSVSLTWIERIVVGIVGAVVGGTVASLLTTGTLNITAAGGFDILSIILAVIGALIALFVWKRVVRRRAIV